MELLLEKINSWNLVSGEMRKKDMVQIVISQKRNNSHTHIITSFYLLLII